MNPKFKRSESFYIRDGWLQKALHTINSEKETNIFSKNNGILYLGIGSNMVKGLKYWLSSAELIETTSSKTNLSELSQLILHHDPYLESHFTWFLIHTNLVLNEDECPIFHLVFNSNIKKFRKDEITNVIYEIFKKDFANLEIKKEYVEDDINVFLKSYTVEDKTGNPEDNYICPLASLELLEKRGDSYIKTRPFYKNLSYLNVYYLLSSVFKNKSFNIEDCINEINSPLNVFNIDKNMLFQYLSEMQKNNLITINKTAGLNTVYFNKKIRLSSLFDMYFGD